MENWITSLHLTKEIEIKIQLIATTFSHSFLLWTECALKIHLQNHPNAILSVLTLVQIYHSHTQCRVSMTWTVHLHCCSIWVIEKNHNFIYSPALNAQHLLQPPNFIFFFRYIFLQLAAIYPSVIFIICLPALLMTVQMCPVKNSCHSSNTEFPEHSPPSPLTPFRLFTDSYPYRNLKTKPQQDFTS